MSAAAPVKIFPVETLVTRVTKAIMTHPLGPSRWNDLSDRLASEGTAPPSPSDCIAVINAASRHHALLPADSPTVHALLSACKVCLGGLPDNIHSIQAISEWILRCPDSDLDQVLTLVSKFFWFYTCMNQKVAVGHLEVLLPRLSPRAPVKIF
jgi:hypothetical protein